jgi:hypothetical protein
MDNGLLLMLVIPLSVAGFAAGRAAGARFDRAPGAWVFVYGAAAFLLLLAIGMSNYRDDEADSGGLAFQLPLLAALFVIPALMALAAGARSDAGR